MAAGACFATLIRRAALSCPPLCPVAFHALGYFIPSGTIHCLPTAAFARDGGAITSARILQRFDDPLNAISLLHQLRNNPIEIHISISRPGESHQYTTIRADYRTNMGHRDTIWYPYFQATAQPTRASTTITIPSHLENVPQGNRCFSRCSTSIQLAKIPT